MEAVETISPDDVKRGDLGVGWSVFQGDAPDSFQVEILGVFPTSTPTGELILAKLTGQGLSESGVIAGMSGSPVFIGGKLLGAVAYGWPFSSEAIAGITPIQKMLDVEMRPGGKSTSFLGRREKWEKLWSASPLQALQLLSLDQDVPRSPSLHVIAMPLVLGAFSGAFEATANEWLQGAGLLPVTGASKAADAVEPPPLKPGSSIAVDLVRGDAQVTGIGTVTWVEGNQVYALGHPMFGDGSVLLPMSSSTVVTVLPSRYQSFKMGTTGRPLGAVTHDYQPGIAGTLGLEAPVIPVSIRLETPLGERNLSFEVAQIERLTPLLIGLVAGNAVGYFDRGAGPATISLDLTAKLTGGRILHKQNLLAGTSPPQQVSGDVARTLGLLYGNPWEALAVQELSLSIGVVEGLSASGLERIQVSKRIVRPGESVEVEVYLMDYRGERHRESAILRIPRTARKGEHHVVVCAGQDARRARRDRSPGTQQAHDMNQLIQLLEAEPPDDSLWFELVEESSYPVVRGYELPNLPVSWERVFDSSQISGRSTKAKGRVLDSVSRRIGKSVQGCYSVSIQVEGD